MTKRIEAIYESGVLKPIESIALPEGAHIEIILLPTAEQPKERTPAEILREIAALPEECQREAFSGRDHDQILYPVRPEV